MSNNNLATPASTTRKRRSGKSFLPVSFSSSTPKEDTMLSDVATGLAPKPSSEDPLPAASSVRNLTKADIVRLSSEFSKISADKKKNTLTKAEFSKCMGLVGCSGLADLLFDTFDADKSGTLDYEEFLTHMATLTSGTVTERLEFAFTLIDHDRNGLVSKDEFRKVVLAMQKVLDTMNLTQHNDLNNYVDEVWKMLDTNNDGNITLEEYKENAMKNPELLKGLGMLKDDSSAVKNVNMRGSKVSFGSAIWDQTINIMMGIRLAMEFIGVLKRSVKKEDFSVKVSFELPRAEYDTSEPKLFIDYAPHVFRAIRTLCNISEESYALALGPEQMLGNFMLGNLSSLSAKISEGKSGSMFFFSNDGRFRVKTLSKDESEKLKQILPEYYKHLVANPNSLLVKFLGFHELDGTQCVVMTDIFDPFVKFDEIYDLKGSTAGRTNGGKGGVKKDLDLQRKLRIGAAEREKLLGVMARDVEFLAKCNIIDYSLLLGIRKFEGEYVRSNSSLEYKSIDSKEAFAIGIIDFLIDFNLKKSVEHVAKSMINLLDLKKKQASCVPPQQYSKRFSTFMHDNVFSE